MNDMFHSRCIDPERREALQRALDDEIERGLAQVRSGQVVDLEALFDELERDLSDDGAGRERSR